MINMKKKFISLLMIIAMMFSMLPANVVDIKAATGKTAIISVEGKNAIPGSTVSVNVSIKDNPGILGSVLRVEYDSKLTLTDAKSGEAFSTLVMTSRENSVHQASLYGMVRICQLQEARILIRQDSSIYTEVLHAGIMNVQGQ